MKVNTKSPKSEPILTHGGAVGLKESALKELTKTVSCCMLWEDAFYEGGDSIANRIASLSEKVDVKDLSTLAIKARTDLKLRHVPLYLCVQMLKKGGSLVGETISKVINRADELTEILAIYQKVNGKDAPLPKQLKVGIAKAFTKFNEYQLAKYNRDSEIKLRDAMFLCHPKPKDKAQEKLWKKLVNNELKTPDTWEVALSAGKDKAETFTRLLKTEKLGYLALLKNLRNMVESGVDTKLVEKAIRDGAKDSCALPFRFISAAKYAPKLEAALSDAIEIAASGLPKLKGKTLVVVDISGSMNGSLAKNSETTRMEAAFGLAMLIREQAEDITLYATAGDDGAVKHDTRLVPARHAFALADAFRSLYEPMGGGGVFLKQCMEHIAKEEHGKKFDRVIVITDEQDCDIGARTSKAPTLGKYNYIINVGCYTPGLPVLSAGWTKVSGFSERVIDWMMDDESTN